MAINSNDEAKARIQSSTPETTPSTLVNFEPSKPKFMSVIFGSI